MIKALKKFPDPDTDNKLMAANETAIRTWLSFIQETDPALINEVLDKCRSNPDALNYFLWRAKDMPHQH